MATMTAARQRLRADDIFFPAMSLLILGIVVFGFAQSYFLPGMVLAKLPNALVHIHGALFVSWIFLLLAQSALVAVRRIRWHMALGLASLVLPPLMVGFGIRTLLDSIRRNGTGIPASFILTGDLEELALFVWLTAWAFLLRRKPAPHKRLMILGTLALMGPAVNRWPWSPAMRLPGTIGVCLALPLLVVAYDLLQTRRVAHTTVIPTAAITLSILTLPAVAGMRFWEPVIAHIRHT